MSDKNNDHIYLNHTKAWFQNKFNRDLNNEYWKNIKFSQLLQREDKFLFGRLSVALGREGCVGEDDVMGEYVDNLLEHLRKQQSSCQQQETKNNCLTEQFKTPYKGQVDKALMENVTLCYKEWKKQLLTGRWHAPYFSLVQSSGYGKSRACKEIAVSVDPNWLTVYICCRDASWKGYPPQTKPAVEFFKSLSQYDVQTAIKVTEFWIKWFVYCRLVFRLMFLRLWNDCVNIDKIVEDLANKDLNQLKKDWSIDTVGRNDYGEEAEKAEREAFWSLCPGESNRDSMNKMFRYMKTQAENMKKLPEDLEQLLGYKSVLLVVDEARFLVRNKLDKSPDYTFFRVFRGATKEFKTGLFAIFVDTQSQIANFSPSPHKDPSLRLIPSDDNQGSDLFHPYTALTTIDVLRKTDGDSNTPEYRYTLGRPLWQTVYANSTIHGLLDFARMKLFGGLKAPDDAGKIACMAVLTGINISPISTTAMELVASHMATCMAIDSDRESVVATYPVEPVLAEAAKGFLCNAYKEGKLADILQPLLRCFRIGTVDRGHNGELVAKILLLLGQFQVSPTGSLFGSCHEMLQKLFGDVITKGEGMSAICTGDEFSFNCFAELVGPSGYWSITNAQTELELFFSRGAAIQLPKGQYGADLLLPIRRKRDNENKKPQYKFLLFQVKNHKDDMTESETVVYEEKLQKVFGEKKNTSNEEEGDKYWVNCDIGFSIIMNVGQKSEGVAWHPQDPTRTSPGRVAKKPRVGHGVAHKYFIVKGLGSQSYRGVLTNQDKLQKSLYRMLREPCALDWIVGGEQCSRETQELDMMSLNPISFRPSIATKKEEKPSDQMDTS